jgi:DNA invertase Pin-like site-specific DNA recombinase
VPPCQSTIDQNLDLQIGALRAAGCEVIRSEKRSGTTTVGREERQPEGIADAKARGVYKGRKTSIDSDKVRKMKAEGMGASAIAKALKIGRASVYRALES